MIGWGEVLNAEQINQLVAFIRKLTDAETAATAGPVSFASDVLPIFDAKCAICHGIAGGWDASSYEAVMNTGDNAPAVIPGDPEGSLLAKKLLGTQEQGAVMPPAGALAAQETQLILNWIAAGALDN
jgi:mono/diheme cytochrome c family protein